MRMHFLMIELYYHLELVRMLFTSGIQMLITSILLVFSFEYFACHAGLPEHVQQADTESKLHLNLNHI